MKYEAPVMELVSLAAADIITTSYGDDNNNTPDDEL